MMRIRIIVSSVFVAITTGLYFLGVCQWDLWIYLLSVLCAITYMCIFVRQQKKYDYLMGRIENK